MAGAPPTDQALSLLAAANNHGDLAVKMSSLKQAKDILLSTEPSLAAELFPYLVELQSSPESLVRKSLLEWVFTKTLASSSLIFDDFLCLVILMSLIWFIVLFFFFFDFERYFLIHTFCLIFKVHLQLYLIWMELLNIRENFLETRNILIYKGFYLNKYGFR